MVKTPGLRRPHSEKEKLRAEIRHNKEMTRHILSEAARAKEEHRARRAENIKRREENAKRAEIVQVVRFIYLFHEHYFLHYNKLILVIEKTS